MQLFKLIPGSIAILLSVLFPAVSVHREPIIAYSTIKVFKPLVMPPMAVYQPLNIKPLPYLPMGTLANAYAPGNCTWGVASMKKTIPNDWGNAAQWADRAQAEGITVSATPIVGSVAQHGGGLGHVGLVVGVRPGEILLEEMNWDWQGGVRTDWQQTGHYVYIYV